MWFVLGAFAPVGDGAGDEDLAIGQVADLGRGGFASRRAAALPGGPLGGPVTRYALG